MPWISAKSADKLISGQCLKMEVGRIIRVESFKGDRWVEIKRVNENSFEITEKGYNNQKITVTADELKEKLKRIFDVEFPRSHQLRVNYTS